MKLTVTLFVIASLGVLGWLVFARGVQESSEPLVSPPLQEGSQHLSSQDQPDLETADIAAVDNRSDVPEAVTEFFAVRVRTLTIASSAGKPVPDIRIEVGARSSTREPFVLADGETDARGVLNVELPWTAVAELAGTAGFKLWGRVIEEGYQEQSNDRWLPSTWTADSVTEIKLVAWEGATLRGTLLDTAGNPTSGTISGRRLGFGGGLALRWKRGGSAMVEADGRFELHVRQQGKFRLTAFGPRDSMTTGMAALGPFDVTLEDPPQDLTMQLVGPGVVRGRVLDGEGAPAEGLDLYLVTEAGDVGSSAYGFPRKLGERYEEEGVGFYSRMGTTDPEGRFAFFGLRDDEFLLRAGNGREGRYPRLLTRRAVLSDGRELTLILERPHLVVDGVDSMGSPISLDSARKTRKGAGLTSGWSDTPAIFVRLAPEFATQATGYNLFVSGKRIADGTLLFDLDPHAEYIVTLLPPGRPSQHERVAVKPDSGRLEVQFLIEDPAPTGFLEVEVIAPDGKPVRSNVSVRVYDLSTFACLSDKRDFYIRKGENKWPATFELPPGEYGLDVESLPNIGFIHGTLRTPRAYGSFRSTIAVKAGSTTTLSAQLSPPAHLLLTVSGASSGADVAAVRAIYISSRYSDDDYAEQARFATVRMRRSEGYPLDVGFERYGGKGTSSAGYRLYSTIELGSTETSEALTPGKYILEVELPGGRTEQQAIELIAGETLAVTLEISES